MRAARLFEYEIRVFWRGDLALGGAVGQRFWALNRVDSTLMPIQGRPILGLERQRRSHFVLYSSVDRGRTFDRVRDFGDYGEMYMSIVRLQDRRLLLTFTVRSHHPPLGVRAIPGSETEGRVQFRFHPRSRHAGYENALALHGNILGRRTLAAVAVSAPRFNSTMERL